MSDRKNRDVGRKRQQKHYNCGCWLCTDGKTKKRILQHRESKYTRQLEEQS